MKLTETFTDSFGGQTKHKGNSYIALALVLRSRISTGTKIIAALKHNIDSTTTLARGANSG